MLTINIILTVFTVLQALALLKKWRRSDGEGSSLRWQALMYGLSLLAFAILLFMDFGLQVDHLPTGTPTEALRAMNLQQQRVGYSVAAVLFAGAGFAIYFLTIHRRAA
jgi:hypothetical protein